MILRQAQRAKLLFTTHQQWSFLGQKCTFTTSSIIRARSHYDILGVPFDANKALIKDHFYRLSKKHHPDRNPENREESAKKMQELSEAYSTLSDDSSRRQYDSTLPHGRRSHHVHHHQNKGGAGTGGPSSGSYAYYQSLNLHRHKTATYAWQNPRRRNPNTHFDDETSRSYAKVHRKRDYANHMNSNANSEGATSSSFVHEAQRQARQAALHAERIRKNQEAAAAAQSFGRSGHHSGDDHPPTGEAWVPLKQFTGLVAILCCVGIFRSAFGSNNNSN